MSNPSNSNHVAKGQAPGGITPADVFYALFRHKWKVLLLSALGVVAAGILYVQNKPPFVSEAKLLVRYVMETRSVEALGPEGQVRTPQTSSGNIVNSESEIIQSMDLCRQVAESIGPERILAMTKLEGSSNLVAAAGMIYGGLNVEIPKLSNVIKLSMTHPDPEIARLALRHLIDFYFKRHVETHRGLGNMDAILAQLTDQVRSRLVQTDEELRDLRTKAGVLSLEDSKRAITEQMGNIRQMILTAEAELAEHLLYSKPSAGSSPTNSPVNTNALSSGQLIEPVVLADSSVAATNAGTLSERAIEYRRKLVEQIESLRQQELELRGLRSNVAPGPKQDPKQDYTDQIGRIRRMLWDAQNELNAYSNSTANPAVEVTSVSNTTVNAPVPNQSSAMLTGTNEVAGAAQAPSPERFQEYKALLGRIESLHRQEQDLRSIYTDENRSLIRVRQQLADAEKDLKNMEKENPAFASYFDPLNSHLASAPGSSVTAPVLPAGMQSGNLNRARELEAKIKFLKAQLEQQRQEAATVEQFETSLNQLLRKRELDEKNYRHFSAGLEQARFDEALGSGKQANISEVQAPSPPRQSEGKRMKIAGIALAAGIFGGIGLALLIELMLDRSVRRSGQLESTLALPLLFTIPRLRGSAARKIPQISNGAPRQNGESSPSIPGWSNGHPLRSHIEALRDRTLMHFEGDVRKPKLIGITSCRDGAGVTTIACALAAALSETDEGRVLLINLNVASQSLHPFLIGQEACSLVDVVDAGKRETALIGNNLYVASGNTDGSGSSALLPTSIARILPKIKMSDYDYVVFDMPTVSPSSITGKLAGMVDLVFMVVESEKDSQNNLKRACQVLTENHAKFRIVLNKFERYIPKWLDDES